MGLGKSFFKALGTGVSAYRKSKADDILAAAKAVKDKADKLKQAKEAAEKLKTAYNAGVGIGKKAGSRSTKRKLGLAVATGGAIYAEGKTGIISKTAKKGYNLAKEKYKENNSKNKKSSNNTKPKTTTKPKPTIKTFSFLDKPTKKTTKDKPLSGNPKINLR